MEYLGGEFSRRQLTPKQLERLPIKERVFVDGEQVPIGIEVFTKNTNTQSKMTGFSNIKRESSSYLSKVEVRNYFSDLFLSNLLTEQEILFMYIILNYCYHKTIATNTDDLLIKGGTVLSVFKDRFYKLIKANWEKLSDKQKYTCKNFIEEFKPKISDLDIIVPVPDGYSIEKRMAIGYNIYREFGNILKEEGLLRVFSIEFCKIRAVRDILEVRPESDPIRDKIRSHILTALNIKGDIKTADFTIQPTGSYSTYIRNLKGFNLEAYRLNPEGPETFLTCSCVEGIVCATSKINPTIFNLCKIMFNFRICYKDKSFTVKLSAFDLPLHKKSLIKSRMYKEVKLNLHRPELNNIKTKLFRDQKIDNKVHMITIEYAINHDIRDMLYNRNNFVFEDTKYEKRVKRDLLYNALLLYYRTDINRVRSEITNLQDTLLHISEEAESYVGTERRWLEKVNNASQTKLKSQVYQHIIDSLHLMSGILLLPNNSRPTYININAYTNELKNLLDQIIFHTAYLKLLFFECSNLLAII